MNITDTGIAILKQFTHYNPSSLPEDEAERQLRVALQEAETDAEDLVSDCYFRHLPGIELRFDALTSLAHSMGSDPFCRSEVARLILNRAKPAAIKKAWLRMPTANPENERDLPARRAAEFDLFNGRVHWYLDAARRPQEVESLTTNDILRHGFPPTLPRKRKK